MTRLSSPGSQAPDSPNPLPPSSYPFPFIARRLASARFRFAANTPPVRTQLLLNADRLGVNRATQTLLTRVSGKSDALRHSLRADRNVTQNMRNVPAIGVIGVGDRANSSRHDPPEVGTELTMITERRRHHGDVRKRGRRRSAPTRENALRPPDRAPPRSTPPARRVDLLICTERSTVKRRERRSSPPPSNCDYAAGDELWCYRPRSWSYSVPTVCSRLGPRLRSTQQNWQGLSACHLPSAATIPTWRQTQGGHDDHSTSVTFLGDATAFSGPSAQP